jgi:hypothetical protein
VFFKKNGFRGDFWGVLGDALRSSPSHYVSEHALNPLRPKALWEQGT